MKRLSNTLTLLLLLLTASVMVTSAIAANPDSMANNSVITNAKSDTAIDNQAMNPAQYVLAGQNEEAVQNNSAAVTNETTANATATKNTFLLNSTATVKNTGDAMTGACPENVANGVAKINAGHFTVLQL